MQVLASPTENMGTLLNAVHRVAIGGSMKLSNAIQVALLALKHRRNKAGSQRVVVFIGSPITEDEKTLTKIGKLLKKNNVRPYMVGHFTHSRADTRGFDCLQIAVDVVSLGEIEENGPKLQVFVDATNSNNNRCVRGLAMCGRVPRELTSNAV